MILDYNINKGSLVNLTQDFKFAKQYTVIWNFVQRIYLSIFVVHQKQIFCRHGIIAYLRKQNIGKQKLNQGNLDALKIGLHTLRATHYWMVMYSLVQWIGYTFDVVWSQIYFIPHQKCIQFTGPNCRYQLFYKEMVSGTQHLFLK